jgi:hypothetical protein
MIWAVDRFLRRMSATSAGVPGSESANMDGVKDGTYRDDRGSSLELATSRHIAPTTEFVLRAAGVAIGSAITAVSALKRALGEGSRTVPASSVSEVSSLSLVPGAALGLAANVTERGMDLAARVIAPAGRFLIRTTTPVTRSLDPYARRILVPLHQDWQVTAEDARAAAGEFGASLETQIVRAALQSMDITEIVREGVDLNSLVGEVDVDRIAARLDLDAVIARVDFPRLVQEVLDDIDLPDLIRESTGTLTADAIEEVRYVSVSADRTIARAMDRLIRRHRRHLEAPGEPTSLSSDRDEHGG